MNKQVLRAQARARRDEFVAGKPAPIEASVEFLTRLRPCLIVATYVPLGGEADPSLLAAAAVTAGCTLALPHVVNRATPLSFLHWDGSAPLAAGPFGLQVPHADWPEVAPDVILTPLLAFDALLNRLGQGAGHYDRAFERYPRTWRVGVAWSVQRIDALPADPWDVPLHNLLTEQEWLTR